MIYSLLSDVWSIIPAKLEAFVADIKTIHECATIGELNAVSEDETGLYEVKDGVAHVSVRGPLMKDVPGFFAFFGLQASSYADIADAMFTAHADSRVSSIQLDVDSPGGTVSGITGAADAIHQVREAGDKPVHANIEGLAASAAYWLASQAETITGERDALAGSIGVYQTVADFSEAAQSEGIKVHVIRSAPHKGVGIDGAEITADHLEALQKSVDSAHEMFVGDVARGRNMTPEQVQSFATGEVWYAAEAVEKGLMDSIGSSSANKQPMEEPSMTEEKDMSAELAALNARIDELSAKKTESDNLVASLVAGQVSAIITKGQADGRIVGTMVDTVTEYANACGNEVGKFDAFVASLPVLTRADQIGNEGDASKIETDTMSRDEKSACLKWGIDPESYKKFSKVSQISMCGMALCEDGEVVKVGG